MYRELWQDGGLTDHWVYKKKKNLVYQFMLSNYCDLVVQINMGCNDQQTLYYYHAGFKIENGKVDLDP
jgi:hypothetical protein